jgi:hypothetical protein
MVRTVSTRIVSLARRTPVLEAARAQAATPDDVEAIARLWHEGWRDGHLGHVPEALEPHRTLAHFRPRVPPRVHATTVATTADGIVGFVTVQHDEVEGGTLLVPSRRYEKRMTRAGH